MSVKIFDVSMDAKAFLV